MTRLLIGVAVAVGLTAVLLGCTTPPAPMPPPVPAAPLPAGIAQRIGATGAPVFWACTDCPRPTPKTRPSSIDPRPPAASRTRYEPPAAPPTLPIAVDAPPAAVTQLVPAPRETLRVTMYFPAGSAAPTAASRVEMDWAALADRVLQIDVTGSADCTGTAARNAKLAQARAHAAAVLAERGLGTGVRVNRAVELPACPRGPIASAGQRNAVVVLHLRPLAQIRRPTSADAPPASRPELAARTPSRRRGEPGADDAVDTPWTSRRP